MKNINILIAQDIKEYRFIKSKTNLKYICVPVNLETLLYYKTNKINYLNPSKFLGNKFHRKGVVDSARLEKSINKKHLSKNSLIYQFKFLVRYYFNSCFFLNELIKGVLHTCTLNKILVSGWNKTNPHQPNQNYIVSEIYKLLFPNKTLAIRKIKKNKKLETCKYRLEKNYKISDFVFFSNYGYNSKKIKKKLNLQNIKRELFLTESPIPFWKKSIFNLIGVKFLLIKKIHSKSISKIITKKIKFKKINSKILKLINNRLWFFNIQLNNTHNKCKLIINFLKENKPKFQIFNMATSLERYCNDYFKKKIRTICIPHGTVSKGYNNYDRKYKKMIAQNVILDNADEIYLQSKIAEKGIKTFNKSRKINYIKKNIIFGNNSKPHNPNKILYAVTMKNLSSIQFYGVETFYEHYSNLKFLDDLAKTNNLKILVKPHPTVHYLIEPLKKEYKNLEFTKTKISKILNYVYVTLSFSSTVIEDSINSHVPVILLDRWKRYMHCDSEKNFSKLNRPIYYVSNKIDLLKALNCVRRSNKINFKKIIF